MAVDSTFHEPSLSQVLLLPLVSAQLSHMGDSPCIANYGQAQQA
jgi:hypothetical protein